MTTYKAVMIAFFNSLSCIRSFSNSGLLTTTTFTVSVFGHGDCSYWLLCPKIEKDGVHKVPREKSLLWFRK